MDLKIGISDEQLAYLNDNLDLVSEYTEIIYIKNTRGSKASSFHCAAVNFDPWPDYVSLRVNIVPHGIHQCQYYWRPLLQFVENHQNAPPIFK